MLRFLIAPILLTSPLLADWPQHLGPNRNGSTQEIPNLNLKQIANEGLTESWRIEVGSGFAGPVVADDTVYLFHRVDDLATLSAHSLTDGTTHWESTYPTTYRDDFGFDDGPRATPAIAGEHIFTYGAEGILRCVEINKGTEVWQRDLTAELNAEKGFFGRACSPLIHQEKVILNIGGTNAGVVAFDTTTGETVWTATNHEAGYSAPIMVETEAGLILVTLTREGIVSINPKTGDILYETPFRSTNSASVNAATPIQIGKNHLFFTAAYDVGATSFALSTSGKFSKNWHIQESLDAHYSTPIFTGTSIIGFHGRQESGQELRAIDPNTGNLLWSESNLGNGIPILAGNLLLILNDDGEIILTTPTDTGLELHLRQQILKRGHRSPPALTQHQLLVRDEQNLICIPIQ